MRSHKNIIIIISNLPLNFLPNIQNPWCLNQLENTKRTSLQNLSHCLPSPSNPRTCSVSTNASGVATDTVHGSFATDSNSSPSFGRLFDPLLHTTNLFEIHGPFLETPAAVVILPTQLWTCFRNWQIKSSLITSGFIWPTIWEPWESRLKFR